SALQKSVESKRRELDEIKAKLDAADTELIVANTELANQIDKPLEPLKRAFGGADDALKNETRRLDRFAKTTAEKTWKVGEAFRSWPIIDGFASPTKIDQITLNDLPIDYGGFKDVTRFDRCTTCHLGIDKPGYDREALAGLGEVPPGFAARAKDAHAVLVE